MTRDEAYRRALDYYKGDDLAAKVLIGKYCINDGESWHEATWNDVAKRVAKNINHKYGSEEDYLWLLQNKYFIPGGRGLFAIGNPYNRASIANCYYIPITEDSIEGIFEAAKRAARTYSYGGGVGLTLDLLRPKGSPTANAAKASTGVVPFMELFSKSTGIIGQCIQKNQRVLTNRGLLEIKDVCIGDKVWTRRGWQKVIGITKNKKPICQIVTRHGYSLRASADHIIMDDKLQVRPIKDFSIKDKVVLLLGKGTDGDLPSLNSCKYPFKREGDVWRYESMPSDNITELNEDLAYFVGFSYGNGYVWYDKHNEPQCLELSIAGDLVAVRDKLCGILDKYKINYTNKNCSGNCFGLRISNKPFLYLLQQNGLLKERAKYIRCPEKIMTSPSRIQWAFISGYYDADGKKPSTKHGYTMCSISYSFLKSIQKILLANGVISRIHVYKRKNPKWHVLYSLSITGRVSISVFTKNTSSIRAKSRPLTVQRDGHITPFTRRMLGVDASYSFMPSSLDIPISLNSFDRIDKKYTDNIVPMIVDDIVSIEKLGSDDVYDLQLEDEHLFWCEGFYVHNSGRRGAQLLAINIAHPDVEDVIEAKKKGHNIKFANVSVIVTDKFMEVLEKDGDWDLWYPDLVRDALINYDMAEEICSFSDNFKEVFFCNVICPDNKDRIKALYNEWMELQEKYQVNIIPMGWYSPYYLDKFDDYIFICEDGRLEYRRKKIYRTVKARDLWRKIAESAWDSAEPGVVFMDTIKRRTAHTEAMFMEIGGLNPCGEQCLQNFSNCCLGNINLSALVVNEQIDFDLLSKVVDLSIKFLNDMMDYGLELHPLLQQKLMSYLTRRIGLGFTGLADMFLKLGVRYGSKESIGIAHSVMQAIRKQAFTTSIQLAKEFGAFPLYDKNTFKSEYIDEVLTDLDDEVKKDFEEYGIYNSNLLTVPPVGSGSIILQTSTGMEPVFAWRYTKKTESVAAGEHHVYHPYLKQYLEENNLTYEEWERNKEDYWVTAHEIDYKDRVKLQGVITHYLDSSLSSTVNLPEETTVEEIEDLYKIAHKCGCKGITIYRDGCSLGSVLKKEERTPKQIIDDYLMNSIRYKVTTPTNSLHVFINYDKDKKPLEVFISHGKAGSDEKADHEALGRVLSKALQYGCPPEEIVDTLTDITGQQVWFHKGKMYKSIPDAIGKILGDFIGKVTEAPTGKKCPMCGEYEVEKEGGCEICKSCGWSKCG